MSQTRLDRSNQNTLDKTLANIDGNFDDLFDVVQVLDAAYTLASQTAAQAMLNGSPNGALTLPIGLYEFEAQLALSAMSASSGGFGFSLLGAGTATFDSQGWEARAFISTAEAGTFVGAQTSYNVAANTELVTAAASDGVGFAAIRGVFRVSAAGTVIPSVSLTVAAAAVVAKNSFFRVKKLSPAYKTAVIAPPAPNYSKINWS